MNLEPLKRWVRRHRGVEAVAYVLHNNLFPFVNFSGASLCGLSVAESVAVTYPVFSHHVPGAPSVMVFALLVTVLTVRPRGLLGSRSAAASAEQSL